MDLPPFRGGFAVALSYDAARRLDDFAPWLARAAADRAWPDFDLRLYGAVGAVDHATGRAFWVAPAHPFFAEAPAARVEAARARAQLALRAAGDTDADDTAPAAAMASPGALASNLTDAEYARAFDRIQEYLRAGDLYQANLTRRFDAPCGLDAPTLHARLRRVAPAPYAGLLDDPLRAVVSASPELFLARRGERLVTRPIKGTRPRDPDPARDRALAAELVKSAKDRAEHVMIVDVHRNDLGRVCAWGSVRVPALAAHEAFPTVHHLTSTIEGRLAGGEAALSWAAIAAAFPAGSITGAPKRRACEVIEELEPTRRALYCGALGWWDLGGDFALNVAIRTILLSGGLATFQSGGGIVIDSQVELEAAETWNKARALHAAVTGGAAVSAR
jgi:para-aminobenzoate synthetase component 1